MRAIKPLKLYALHNYVLYKKRNRWGKWLFGWCLTSLWMLLVNKTPEQNAWWKLSRRKTLGDCLGPGKGHREAETVEI